MDPKGKVALVTGGARRVGKAITLGLARAGANVIIHYNTSADAARETETDARALCVDAIAVQADTADRARVTQMVDAALERFGRIDILVNSASPFQPTPFPMEDVSGWHHVIDSIVHGSFYVTNAVAPVMLRQKGGVIVNIVDTFAFEPRRNYAAHCVAKAALLAMTRQFALDLAPNVRVNAVAPGPVLPPPDFTPERLAVTADRTLLERWGTPEDVVDAVLYLVRAEYVTAEVIRVNGGEQFGRNR